MASVLEAPVKAVDGSDQPAGNRVQVAAFASGKVHRRSQGSGGLFRVQTGAGKVQGSGGGVLHAEGGICRSLFHGLVQQFRFLGGVSHRLVGELHGLVDLGKARRASRADSGKGERDVRGQGFSGVFHLAAEFLHLFPGGGDLLRLHGAEVLIFLFQAFQALLGLGDLPLKGVVLLLGNGAVLERLVRLFGGFLQRIQLFLGGLNLLLEGPVLLGKQLRIAGVQLQQFFHVLQLGLCVLDFGVDALQRGLELCGVAPDFYSDSLDS